MRICRARVRYGIDVQMAVPETSTTLLRDLAKGSQRARWCEFVARYRPMMEAHMRERFSALDADDVIQETLIAVCRIMLRIDNSMRGLSTRGVNSSEKFTFREIEPWNWQVPCLLHAY